ncbi:MAG: right-handed parallel beta-helix repeat-containing protein, partial [Phycisphaeraceae bacterium]|nr:right-handed parallel beta-helix repeat-containing protein [Phycisphaeraceae bacterium]
MLTLLVLCVLLAAASRAPAQTIIYENAAAAPGGNGQSWQTAYNNLESGLSEAAAVTVGDVEIWVGAGTYYPTRQVVPSNARTYSFEIRGSVPITLRGGFVGNEASPFDRPAQFPRTTLSGDIARNDTPNFGNRAENSWHVVYLAIGRVSVATLEGFTISGGNADPSVNPPPDRFFVPWGAGVFCDAIFGGTAISLKMSRCVVEDNVTISGCAGAYFQEGAATIDRCAFRRNRATGGPQGTALYFDLSRATVSNSLFVFNEGVAMFLRGADTSAIDVINCTIAFNQARGVQGYDESSSELVNCIVWGNGTGTLTDQVALTGTPIVRFSSMQGYSGAPAGEGNNALNPNFINPLGTDGVGGTDDDDFGLSSGSPSVDTGDTAAVPSYVYADYAQRRRLHVGSGINTAVVDRGPLEFGAPQVSSTLFVSQIAQGGNSGLNWQDAFTGSSGLQSALAVAAQFPEDIGRVWVSAGTYTPSPPLSQGGSRSASFQLRNNLAIYGGFAGNETELSQRPPFPATLAAALDPSIATVLSGDLNGDDTGTINRSDNSLHVIRAIDIIGDVRLDGVTIAGGEASGPTVADRNHAGGGLTCQNASPVISNCWFTGNRGQHGALDLYQCAGVSIIDCVFEQNATVDFGIEAGIGGGAAFTDGTSAVFRRCTFSENSARGEGGAIMVYGGSNVGLVQCTIERNACGTSLASRGYGGGVYVTDSNIEMYACELNGNLAALADGGLHVNVGSALVAGCQFVGNSAPLSAGAVGQVNSSIVVRNCTVVANAVGDSSGSGGYFGFGQAPGPPATASIQNSLFWNNTRAGSAAEEAQVWSAGSGGIGIHLCSVMNWAGLQGGTHNNGLDPRFRRLPSPGADGVWGTSDDDYGDLRLTNGSPAIDSGDSTAVPLDTYDIDADGNTTESLPWDLDGGPRFVDDPLVANTGIGSPPVDRGAYEFVAPIVTAPGDRRWVSPDGGDFASLFNWFPAVPGALDNAVFDIPGAYTVNFAASPPVQTKLLTVSRGHPMFDFNGATYSVTAPFEAAMIVGNTSGLAAELTITNGTIAPFSGLVGAESGSVGTLNVSGAGARLLMTQGDLSVGFFGQGHMRIEDGGRATNRTAGVGDQPGSQGSTVVITGTGSRWTVPFILTINNGSVTVSNGGVLENTFGIVLFQGGSISGNGTIIGPVINFGTVEPGNSPGQLTINGSYTQVGAIAEFGSDSGRLVSQVSGPNAGQFDRLVVNGSATLGGG